MQLQASQLGCVRGARRLYGGVDFNLDAGSALRIAGANGSGKSTLLRTLCGLTPAQEGQVRWNGADIGRVRAAFAGKVFYLGHTAAIKDELTASENLAIASALAGWPADAAAVNKALDDMGAPDGVACRLLSEGQRKRVALARLHLASDRPLWVLDEPFSSLDAAACAALHQLLGVHLKQGGMLVYTTHDGHLVDGKVIELVGQC